MDKKESQQKQKKGAAPFASIEDLSDDSPEDRAKLEVPGARGGVTPRIDISRASSSSHHEDSSPERELFGGEGGGVKVGLGFTEDMALELRSSTEELDFHEPEPERKSKRKKLQQQQAVVVTKYDLETEYEKEIRERKDSGCSEGGLLFIGGRTSRLSSIGSAASGGSGVSAGSAVSHLSAASNLSRASRCSSPHKMLLETSFCGPKPIPTLSLEAEYPPSESVEAALLKRKADPTGAILPNCLEVRDNKPRRCSSERAVRPQVPVQAARSSSARAPKRPNVSKKSDDNELFKIIPLHGSLEDDDDDDSVDNPVEDFQPENGIYIPLKGPIIDCRKQEEEPKRKKPEMEDSELFKFISLHGDDDEVQNKKNNQSVQFKSWEEAAKWVDLTKPRSPEPPKPGRLELEKRKNGRSLGQIPRDDSRTPSPASSYSKGNIFRRSSDSSGSSKKSGGSGDSKSKKDSRNKSMFTALFRKNVKEAPPRKSNYQDKAPIDPKLTNVEYKFKQDEHVIDKDTIIIPLHSPDEVVEPLIRYDPKKDDSDILKDIRPEIRPESSVPDNQRSSLDEHTIEKNIVVVDVINEDSKEPVKNKQSTQVKKDVKAEIKEQIKSEVSEQVKLESKAASTETKKNIKELTKKVEGLEIQHLECEPRVRRSSSVSSREVEYSKDQKESTSKSEEKNVKPETENQETLENERQESDETVRQGSQETVIENPTAKEEVLANDISPNQEDVVLSSAVQDEEIESLIKKEEDSENNLTKSEGHERQSSESEVDMEVDREVEPEECDEERKGLFHQTDSQEDELPYVPTTLPQERSVAVPIIPIRQRVSEVKTCPVERPRSTTPIQPSNLEEYASFHEPRPSLTQEKMQITLPRTDSFGKGRGRGKASSPPPLPPRAPQWVAFDEPERRRPPRRITTLPYTYVNPEECTCECHEAQHRSTKDSQCSKPEQCSYPKKGGRTEKEKEKRYRT